MTEHDREGGIRWNPEISLGAIIQAAVVMCAALAWLITGNIHMNDASSGLAALQQNVTRQIDDLHTAVTSGLDNLQKQISTLPDQRAQLTADDRRLTEDDARFSALENRVSAAEARTVQNAADISTLSRLANTPLPGAPHR